MALPIGMAIVLPFAGLTATIVLLCIPEYWKWQRRQVITERLRVVEAALDQAEEKVVRFQERHDRILIMINSQYLSRRETEEALAEARKAMKDALEFTVGLRRLQMRILSSYPYGNADAFRQE